MDNFIFSSTWLYFPHALFQLLITSVMKEEVLVCVLSSQQTKFLEGKNCVIYPLNHKVPSRLN